MTKPIDRSFEAVVTVRNCKKSSFIKKLSYNRVMQELSIEMASGTYTYYDVPWEPSKTLFEAKSKGKCYGKNIRGQYPSEKL